MSKLITRRSLFVGGIASLICAPAIVKAANIMKVQSLPSAEPPISLDYQYWDLVEPYKHYVWKWTERDGGWVGRFIAESHEVSDVSMAA